MSACCTLPPPPPPPAGPDLLAGPSSPGLCAPLCRLEFCRALTPPCTCLAPRPAPPRSARLRDDLLAKNGVNTSAVKLVPLPSNTATCEPLAGLLLGALGPGGCRFRAGLPSGPPGAPSPAPCTLHPFARCPLPGAAGDIGRTISDYAARSGADAVVIGSRGLGAFRRRMLGLVRRWGRG